MDAIDLYVAAERDYLRERELRKRIESDARALARKVRRLVREALRRSDDIDGAR